MKLQADPQNPNRMDEEDKSRMKQSLAEFGDLSGIVVNRRTGLLIGGHQRADVLADGKLDVRDLKKPEPDGTVARGTLTHDGKRHVVRVVDWDEDRAHAAMVAANRFGRVGHDDADMLTELLRELPDVDPALLGYTDADLAEALQQVPDFAPVGEDELGRLDQKAPITCPHCGKEFVPE